MAYSTERPFHIASVSPSDLREAASVKTTRSCPVVLLSTDVRFEMGTTGQGCLQRAGR